MKTKKGSSSFPGSLLAVFLLVAGTQAMVYAGGQSASDSSGGGAAKAQTVSVYTQYSNRAGWPKLVQVVKDKTGIDINLQPATTVYPDYVTKISSAMATGDSSYDIIDVDELVGSTFIAAGFLEPITDVIQPVYNDFSSTWLENISKGRDGNYYILQTNNVTYNLIVNKDIFDAAGLTYPTNLDEFIAVGQKLTKGDVWGLGVPLKQGGALFNEVIRNIYAFDGDFYNWNNPNTQKAIQFMYDVIHTYKIMPEGALSDGYDEARQRFSDNKYAMAFDWEVGADHTKARLGKDVEIIPIPKFTTNRTMMGAWGLAVSKYSKNKEAAKKVLSAMASREAGECFLEIGNTPNLAVLNSPIAVIKAPVNKYIAEYANAGSLYPRPMPPTINEIQSVMETNVSAFLSRQMSLADCVKNVNEGIADLKP
jgi:multiple sugar transport system substrate-binding protein